MFCRVLVRALREWENVWRRGREGVDVGLYGGNGVCGVGRVKRCENNILDGFIEVL